MQDKDKTHYRKAFNSPYLSSSDIVEPTVLTIQRVALEPDKTKKTKDQFNTAYFVEPEIRKGEALRPMILNAHNSRVMRNLTSSHFLEDWHGVPVTIYVDNAVRFGKETVEGLRISPNKPRTEKPRLTPDNAKMWAGAIDAFKRDGNLDKVRERVQVSTEHEKMIVEVANVPVS
jgi:hypothetical protein